MPSQSHSHRCRTSRIAVAFITLLVLGCTTLTAVDLSQPVDVPDDIGLGERLALVAWLGDHKIPVPDPNDLPALRLAYLKRAHPEVIAAGQPTPEEEKRRGELAAELYRKHGINPPAGANSAVIAALIKQRNEEADAISAQEQAKAQSDSPALIAPPSIPTPLTPEEKQRLTERAAAGIKIGKPFPAIAGRMLDGSPFRLTQYQGKVILISFWATWCHWSMKELPKVKSVYDTFHAKGLEVIGISLDTEKAQLQSVVAALSVPWPQVFDGGAFESPLALQCVVDAIPTSFLIGRDGTLIAMDPSESELSDFIAKALAKAP